MKPDPVRPPRIEPSILAALKVQALVDAVGQEGERVFIHDGRCPAHVGRRCRCEPIAMDVFGLRGDA